MAAPTAVREAFEKGDFDRALNLLDEFAISNEEFASRLYLLYRPELYRLLADWSRSVLDSRELFLPADLYDSEAPSLLDRFQAFELSHAPSLERELASHPDHFRRVSLDQVLIDSAIDEWNQERDVRAKLLFSDAEALADAKEECILIVRTVLKNSGRRLKDFTDQDIIARAKRGLRRVPLVIDAINRRLASLRELPDLDLE